jgi:hypothetical protein
LVKILA